MGLAFSGGLGGWDVVLVCVDMVSLQGALDGSLNEGGRGEVGKGDGFGLDGDGRLMADGSV
jgi:hypothetical protein